MHNCSSRELVIIRYVQYISFSASFAFVEKYLLLWFFFSHWVSFDCLTFFPPLPMLSRSTTLPIIDTIVVSKPVAIFQWNSCCKYTRPLKLSTHTHTPTVPPLPSRLPEFLPLPAQLHFLPALSHGQPPHLHFPYQPHKRDLISRPLPINDAPLLLQWKHASPLLQRSNKHMNRGVRLEIVRVAHLIQILGKLLCRALEVVGRELRLHLGVCFSSGGVGWWWGGHGDSISNFFFFWRGMSCINCSKVRLVKVSSSWREEKKEKRNIYICGYELRGPKSL